MRKNIDATTGKISSIIWKMAIPVMLANLMNVFYNFTDTFWVGRLENSSEAIAAVTVSFTVVFVLVSLAIGLAVAASTLASQYYGAKQYKRIEELLYSSILIIGSFAIIVVITGLTFSKSILTLLNTPKNVMPYAQDYFEIIMFGMFFMFISFLSTSILRGIGDTITPMKVEFITIILNIILDPLLIFGIGPFPELGIAGAAYATVFSRIVGSLYITYYIFSKKSIFKIKLKDFKFDFDIAKKLLKLGIPAASTQVILSLGFMVLIWRVNSFGDVSAAAHGDRVKFS